MSMETPHIEAPVPAEVIEARLGDLVAGAEALIDLLRPQLVEGGDPALQGAVGLAEDYMRFPDLYNYEADVATFRDIATPGWREEIPAGEGRRGLLRRHHAFLTQLAATLTDKYFSSPSSGPENMTAEDRLLKEVLPALELDRVLKTLELFKEVKNLDWEPRSRTVQPEESTSLASDAEAILAGEEDVSILSDDEGYHPRKELSRSLSVYRAVAEHHEAVVADAKRLLSETEGLSIPLDSKDGEEDRAVLEARADCQAAVKKADGELRIARLGLAAALSRAKALINEPTDVI